MLNESTNQPASHQPEIQIVEQTEEEPPKLQYQESLEPPSWQDLKRPLVDLLLKYYNGEDQGQEFVQALQAVMKVLIKWNLYGPINTQSLLNFFID